MKKLLTIVIPTYNMEKYINRCLDTLIIDDATIFDLLEVLIINDGSKDSSSHIAHEYEEKYPNVFRVIDKENGNYGSCINKGIDEARGQYFKILDADDWFNTDALVSLLKKINESTDNIDVYYTEFTYHNFFDDTVTNHHFRSINYHKVYELSKIPFINSDDEFMLKMYSVTIKTEILRSINLRLDTGISYTDNEFVYFPYNHIDKVVFLDYDVYQYFIGREGQSVSLKDSLKRINDVYIIANRFLDDYAENKDTYTTDLVRDVKENYVIRSFVGYFNVILANPKKDETEEKLKVLYCRLKKYPLLLKKARKRAPFFWLWEITGLYKSSSIIRPFYKFLQIMKKIK